MGETAGLVVVTFSKRTCTKGSSITPTGMLSWFLNSSRKLETTKSEVVSSLLFFL